MRQRFNKPPNKNRWNETTAQPCPSEQQKVHSKRCRTENSIVPLGGCFKENNPKSSTVFSMKMPISILLKKINSAMPHNL